MLPTLPCALLFLQVKTIFPEHTTVGRVGLEPTADGL
jgi:hypothetical protein